MLLGRDPLSPARALTRVLQLARRFGRTLQACRVEVAPFVLGRLPVARTTVAASLRPGLRGRQGQRRACAFALRTLDPEEPRHGARAPRALRSRDSSVTRGAPSSLHAPRVRLTAQARHTPLPSKGRKLTPAKPLSGIGLAAETGMPSASLARCA